MKKLISLLLIIATIFALSACNMSDDPANNTPTDNTTDNTPTDNTTDNTPQETEIQETEENTISNYERPYDKYGILYEEEISYYLSDFGSIYWDPTKEFYVLTPRDTFRQVILALAKDPFDETYLEYWDLVTEIIKLVSEEYPSAICIRNPASSTSYLLIIVMGDIGYSAF